MSCRENSVSDNTWSWQLTACMPASRLETRDSLQRRPPREASALAPPATTPMRRKAWFEKSAAGGRWDGRGVHRALGTGPPFCSVAGRLASPDHPESPLDLLVISRDKPDVAAGSVEPPCDTAPGANEGRRSTVGERRCEQMHAFRWSSCWFAAAICRSTLIERRSIAVGPCELWKPIWLHGRSSLVFLRRAGGT